MPVHLVTVDISRTTGRYLGESTTRRLADLSPLGADRCAETVRALLHRTPELTGDLIGAVCDRLLIARQEFPGDWDRGYQPYPGADDALSDISTIAPVVALTNLSVTGGPARASAVRAAHPALSEVYTSFGLGAAKPEPRPWNTIARIHGVDISNIVHIGDQKFADVYGALYAGARVVHVSDELGETTYPMRYEGRVGSVTNLRDAVSIVRAWSRHDEGL